MKYPQFEKFGKVIVYELNDAPVAIILKSDDIDHNILEEFISAMGEEESALSIFNKHGRIPVIAINNDEELKLLNKDDLIKQFDS